VRAVSGKQQIGEKRLATTIYSGIDVKKWKRTLKNAKITIDIIDAASVELG